MCDICSTDKQKALMRDCIYNIDMLLQKKKFQAFIYIKALTNTDVPARLAHFPHSPSIF